MSPEGTQRIAGGQRATGERRPRKSVMKKSDPEGDADQQCDPFRVGALFCFDRGRRSLALAGPRLLPVSPPGTGRHAGEILLLATGYFFSIDVDGALV